MFEEETKMKNLKSVLAVLTALCLMLCLAVPVFATEELSVTSASVSNEAVSTEPTTTEEATAPTAEEGFEGAQPGAEEEEGDIEIPLEDLENADEPEADEHDHDHEEEAESTGHKVVRIILTVLEVIASLALIIIVLIQSGKESGLSGAIAGNSDSYMSKGNRATMDKKLASMTKWVAAAWVVLTLALSLI